MTSEQNDAQRSRLRVARFGEVEPDQADRAAPVARFGDPAGGDPAEESGGTVSHALLGRIGEPVAGRVAPIRERAGRAAAPDEAAPVAGFAHIDDDPPPVARAATVADLGVRRGRGDRPNSPRLADAGSGEDSALPGVARRGGADPALGGSRSRRGGRSGAEPEPDADPVATAREICLRLLTDRARTRQELAQALRRKGVPDDAAGAVLERFDEVGLIDDAAFAGQWVRSRHRNKGLARRAIALELRRKGVDDEVAGAALAEVDTGSEELRARELVDRKLCTMPADTPEQRKKAAPRLVGMLARKGYSGGIAYRVVREALAAHGTEIDELGTDPLD